MTRFAKAAGVALLWVTAIGGCASDPGAHVPAASTAGPALSFVLQNDSRERVWVYLVEPTREPLLGWVRPLSSERLPVPERVLAHGETTITLAIVRNRPKTARPSFEPGTILSVPMRSGSLIGWTFAFTGDFLYQRYR